MAFSDTRYSSVEEAILTTILYSDIFDFPVTRDELWHYLICKKKIPFSTFTEALQNLQKVIVYKDGYYCLKDRVAIIQNRKKNLLEVKKKLRIAKFAAFYLSHIPTIQFIGISGGLAIGDVSVDDDIDFFIICKKNTLFMTRLLVASILEWKGMRRKRNDRAATDKICVNLFLDESRLSWPSKKRDLYTAHEIVQVKPLFERNSTYQKFIDSNTWVTNYLPNSQDEKFIYMGTDWRVNYLVLQWIGFFLFSQPFELFVRFFQKQYMETHRTTEHISKTLLAFHPNNYRSETLKILRSKCDKLGLLTNI